jgi:protoporphyrinogen/coproporphyrinogen III oxidase
MSQNRRDFIKFVIAGSVAAGCPVDHNLLAASTAPHGARKIVDGEHNEICHKVRDGFDFQIPPVSARKDVVIVGGGVSGLAAAYYIKDHEWMLLEKEPHWGGNAFGMDSHGATYATGAAFMLDDKDDAAQLAKELELGLLPINSWDGTIHNGEFVADTWGEGIDKLPYPEKVREDFKKFRKEILAIDLDKRRDELDQVPLTNFLKDYTPELRQWWDGYGPSNWGAMSHETSAMLAIDDLQSNAGENRSSTRSTWPGGNGALTKKLAEKLQAKNAAHMLAAATIIAVEEQKNEVHVTYTHAGQLKTVAAKAVIMATPKFITARIVKNLPEAQREAMMKIRYIPYPVVNLVYEKPVFDKGYDTWCPGNSFTDFIVADWTVRNQPNFNPKVHIISCYTPLHENERYRLLTDEGARDVATKVLRDFKHLMPSTNVDPIEVHIYRRGHPMYMGTPGTFTKVQPIARKAMKRIFFACTDSEGPLSTTVGGIQAAKRSLKEMESALAGRHGHAVAG